MHGFSLAWVSVSSWLRLAGWGVKCAGSSPKMQTWQIWKKYIQWAACSWNPKRLKWLKCADLVLIASGTLPGLVLGKSRCAAWKSYDKSSSWAMSFWSSATALCQVWKDWDSLAIKIACRRLSMFWIHSVWRFHGVNCSCFQAFIGHMPSHATQITLFGSCLHTWEILGCQDGGDEEWENQHARQSMGKQ